jgi:hypothetical protein
MLFSVTFNVGMRGDWMLLNVVIAHVSGYAGKRISQEEGNYSLTPSSIIVGQWKAVCVSSFACSGNDDVVLYAGSVLFFVVAVHDERFFLLNGFP